MQFSTNAFEGAVLVLSKLLLLFCTGLAFHIMKYYILRTVHTSQGYLIHMCICVLVQLNSMVYNVLYSINVYMHRLVIMHSTHIEMYVIIVTVFV